MVGAAIKTPSPSPPPAPKPRPTFVRVTVSIWILWHFLAVFSAALSVPGPTSPLVRNIAQNSKSPLHWYLNALYLNQGHAFFAPDVGCGYLVTFECMDRNNQVIERGELPSRKEHWPRLLYHRYFMLASQAGFDDENKQVRDETQRLYLDAYARQLLYANKDAQLVRVTRFAHWPVPIEYAKGDRTKGYDFLMRQSAKDGQRRQIDPQGYERLGETVVRRSEIEPQPRQQSFNQNSYGPNYGTNTASRWTGGLR
jgi:hypothetical protein